MIQTLTSIFQGLLLMAGIICLIGIIISIVDIPFEKARRKKEKKMFFQLLDEALKETLEEIEKEETEKKSKKTTKKTVKKKDN